jgi:heme-degrading monooxygenase HmoA
MFARLTIVQVIVEKQEEATKIVQESIMPAATQQKGFRGAYMLTNQETGKGYFISLWDSKDDAIENEKSGYYQEQLGKVKEFFAAPPSQEGYEVVAQT